MSSSAVNMNSYSNSLISFLQFGPIRRANRGRVLFDAVAEVETSLDDEVNAIKIVAAQNNCCPARRWTTVDSLSNRCAAMEGRPLNQTLFFKTER